MNSDIYYGARLENVPEFRKWVLYPWWLDGIRALAITLVVVYHAIMPLHFGGAGGGVGHARLSGAGWR